MKYNVVRKIIFCSPPQKIFIFICALKLIKFIFKLFLKMMLVPRGILSLVNSSIIHKSKIVQTLGVVGNRGSVRVFLKS